MTQYKQFIIFVLLLTFFGMLAKAQNSAKFPYEGSTHVYTCNGLSVGADYNFNITSSTGGVNTGEFGFIGAISGIVGADGLATAEIQWNTGSSMNNYEVWLEVSISGCSNKIFLGVSPQPNNRSIGFDVVASTECFNLSGNSFAISFITLDNNGQPIPAAYFPLSVEFDVNGEIHSQTLSFDNQVLQVNDQWFVANPQQNTDVLVALTNITDKNNAPIKPGLANGTHVRSIFAIPEIEFTEELRQQYNLKYEKITAFYDSDKHRLERMEPEYNTRRD